VLVVCCCDVEGVWLKIDPDGCADAAWVPKSEVIAVVATGKAGTDVVAKMCNVVLDVLY
jgi:hypothetical protein